MAAFRNGWLRAVALGISGLSASTCGSTGGKLIAIAFRAGGLSRPAAGPLTFCNDPRGAPCQGWTVTLQSARIALGPFYFNIDPPPGESTRGGVVIIQATEQVVVDPLDPVLKDVPGGADGQTDMSHYCEIDLLPLQPSSPASAADRQLLGSAATAYVAGTATKGSTSVPFAGLVVINTSVATPQQPLIALQRVSGALANLTFASETQTLELRVDPTHWFDAVDFADLLGSAPVNGSYTWSPDNCSQSSASFDAARCRFQFHLLTDGIKLSVGVYQFSLSP
jgi:hypothetical protein